MTNRDKLTTHAAQQDDVAKQLEQYVTAKALLTDFVLDAEDDIATALETFSAEQLSRWSQPTLSGLNRTELAVEMFLGEGQIADQSITDLFLRANPGLPEASQRSVKHWDRSFQGLFLVQTVSKTEADGRSRYILKNWLTDKTYRAVGVPSQTEAVLSRASVGEIILARLVPIADGLADELWVFSGPLTLLGKLGKPKLAVAIGNFKKWFPQQLYGDAPELKEAAWASVKEHYEEFVAFFGAEKITLSGYELNKKLQAYQAQMTEKQLAEAGLDSSKSLQEMAKDAGLSEEEMTEAMDALGEESKAAKQLIESKQSLKMVMPQVNLPDELRKAEAVTVLVHPRWGQAFFNDYQKLESLLGKSELMQREQLSNPTSSSQSSAALPDKSETANLLATLDKLLLKYLKDERANTYVWRQLAQEYGTALENALRRTRHNPQFTSAQDLNKVMADYGKPLTPDLPETASVPIHLHNLFQEALKKVSKGSGGKSSHKKSKKPKRSGFGA